MNFDQLNRNEIEELANLLLKDLFPICRSITGNGVRQTLSRLNKVTPFTTHEVASGTQVYDWAVPDEWNIKDAFLRNSKGETILSFAESNIHVVSYSTPINKKISFAELKPHLHTLPDLPKAIPYRTSYYKRDWGFCLPHELFSKLDPNDTYHAVIDSTIAPGSLTYGEYIHKGELNEEIIISSYCCHPSLANDSLSGQILWSLLLREIKLKKTKYTYRFIMVPETIGAITYLNRNESAMKNVKGGFVLTTNGGPGNFGFKRTFKGDSIIDRVIVKTFQEQEINFVDYPFDVYGSDESHYSAPFFRIPVATISKDKYYEYVEYHTSLDNLDFVSSRNIVDCMLLYLSCIEKIEMESTFQSKMPYCEPMLGKRGLYPALGGSVKQKAASLTNTHEKRSYGVDLAKSISGFELDAISWLMFDSDGKHSLLDISEMRNLPMRLLYETAQKLMAHDLLKLKN